MTAAQLKILLACLLLASACSALANGQQSLQGQVSSDSSQTDFYNVYANSDPLGGKAEDTPTTIGPNNSNRCIPPNPAWRLVAQEENECYWYAPFPHRLNAYIVPLAKISWVESSGGTCGQNPFSNPDNPNGTAVCDQPAPQNNPYAPPVETFTPGAPPTDYYASDPHDPSRLLANYKGVITKASRGDSRQLSQQLGPQLQQDMNACTKYAAQGILSSGCCTDLGQAANFNMEATAPARQQAKMFQQAAATACQFQVPAPPAPTSDPDAPHFYSVDSDGDPQRMKDVLADNPECRQWSATEIICQNTPTQGGFRAVQGTLKNAPPLNGGSATNKHQAPKSPKAPTTPVLKALPLPKEDEHNKPKPPLVGRATEKQPYEPPPSRTVRTVIQKTRQVGCATVNIQGQRPQLISVLLESGDSIPVGEGVGNWKLLEKTGYYSWARGGYLSDGKTYVLTGLAGTIMLPNGQLQPGNPMIEGLQIPVIFGKACQ